MSDVRTGRILANLDLLYDGLLVNGRLFCHPTTNSQAAQAQCNAMKCTLASVGWQRTFDTFACVAGATAIAYNVDSDELLVGDVLGNVVLMSS